MRLKVNARPRHKNAPRIAEKNAPAFLQWIRGRSCLCFPRGGCIGRIEAAHVDYAGDKGMGTKVADRFAVPLCAGHHAEQHRMGWKSFEAKYGFVALSVAELLWSRWPGRIAWERKLEERANG